jgi:hypothetical protein
MSASSTVSTWLFVREKLFAEGTPPPPDPTPERPRPPAPNESPIALPHMWPAAAPALEPTEPIEPTPIP